MRKLAIGILFPFMLNTAHAQDNSLLAKRQRLAEATNKAMVPYKLKVYLSGDTYTLVYEGKRCNSINFLESMIYGLEEDPAYYYKIDIKKVVCLGKTRTILWSAE